MSSRYVQGVAAVLVLTAFYACWCHAPLIWDGAYQFNASLIMQHPYSYLTRFHSYLLWWPTVWASRVTGNVTLLQSIYGLPFLLAPVAGLLVSWWLVRREMPQLIVWVIFGVAIATLPGQIFVINDSIFQQHLFWPIFISLFVPLSIPKRVVLGVLAVFQFVHPLGIILFFGAAVAAALLALADAENRVRYLVRSGVMLFLCLLAVSKVYITSKIPALRDTFAEQEASWATAVDRWDAGVRGWPFRGLICMWLAGSAVLWHRMLLMRGHGKERSSRSAAMLAVAFILAGATCWVYWASDGRMWWKALDYRRWVGPLTAPFFLLATFEAFFTARQRYHVASPALYQSDRVRERLGLLLAGVFAVVLGIQCTIWSKMSARLMAEVERYPSSIVPERAIPWEVGTPLDHWATADYVVAMQGKQPRKLLLDVRSEEHIYEKPPKIPHWDFYPNSRSEHPDPTPGPVGWFDFRPLLAHLTPPRDWNERGPVRLDVKSTPD